MDGTRIAYYFPIYNTFRRMVLWNFTMGNCNVWLFTLFKYSERGKSYPFFKTRASIGLPTVQSIQIVISQLLPILCLFTISKKTGTVLCASVGNLIAKIGQVFRNYCLNWKDADHKKTCIALKCKFQCV